MQSGCDIPNQCLRRIHDLSGCERRVFAVFNQLLANIRHCDIRIWQTQQCNGIIESVESQSSHIGAHDCILDALHPREHSESGVRNIMACRKTGWPEHCPDPEVSQKPAVPILELCACTIDRLLAVHGENELGPDTRVITQKHRRDISQQVIQLLYQHGGLMILDRDSMRCFEELEYLVNFAFDQSNYEPTHPGDSLNVSVAVDSVF